MVSKRSKKLFVLELTSLIFFQSTASEPKQIHIELSQPAKKF